MNTNTKRVLFSVVAILFLGVAFWVSNNRSRTELPYFQEEGYIFGTVYHITYSHDKSLRQGIQEELARFDSSLSTFNKESIISRINRGEAVDLDKWSNRVFTLAHEISIQTEGAFDITVAPLVNAWGFGFKKKENVTQLLIDSIREFVGYEKIKIVNNRIVKQDPRIMLDAAAIAKGYASDVVGEYLESQGVDNYMVEIGGEIFCKGKNPKGEPWSVGITKPVDDSLSTEGEIEEVIQLTNKGLATSGNYRNFYYENGRKYAHTIDPKTGFPAQKDILSSTVIAPTCIEADAYATAFMVMGLQKSIQLVEKKKELEAYFIYTDSIGKMQVIHVK